MGKMLLGTDKKRDEIELNMSPLIDMIFILLIFFLVTTTFVKESGVDFNRPVPGPDNQDKQKIKNIMVNILKDGMVFIDEMDGKGGQAIDIQSIRSRMERFKHESPDGSVIISSDKEALFGISVKVLDQVRLAEITKVVVATTQDD